MTFLEKYYNSKTWQEKCQVMDIFHTVMTLKDRGWTIKHTATYFSCSIGLVSENIRIAKTFDDKDNSLFKCGTREIALTKLHDK